ncbi:MAG: hypothetical protein ACRDP3_04580 [Streptomyces sp.]
MSGVRSGDHLGALELEPAAKVLEQPGAAAEQDRDRMNLLLSLASGDLPL